MRKRTLTIAVVAAGAFASAVLVAACGGGSGYGSSSGGSAPTASASPTGRTAVTAVEGPGDPNTAWKFDPATRTVLVGSAVTFINGGTQQHTATADDGSFDTGRIAPGDQKPVRFEKAGEFAFHCSIHPWMKGTIEVTTSTQ